MKIRWKPLLIQFAISLGVAGAVCAFYDEFHGTLPIAQPAAALPSRLAVRRCLDDPFCPNGSFCIPGLDH